MARRVESQTTTTTTSLHSRTFLNDLATGAGSAGQAADEVSAAPAATGDSVTGLDFASLAAQAQEEEQAAAAAVRAVRQRNSTTVPEGQDGEWQQAKKRWV